MLQTYFANNQKKMLKVICIICSLIVPTLVLGPFVPDLIISLLVLPMSMISSYIFLNIFVLGNALSLNKGSVLGAIVTMPLALPVLIVLGKSVSAIQLDLNFTGFIFLLLGSLSIIIVIVPTVISYIIKAHLE